MPGSNSGASSDGSRTIRNNLVEDNQAFINDKDTDGLPEETQDFLYNDGSMLGVGDILAASPFPWP